MRICSINGCKNRHEAKGFCQKHYLRWKAHGEAVNTPLNRDKSFQERFEEKVELIPFSTCHWWIASVSRRYGQIRRNGKAVPAHRAAYELYIGPIRQGMYVLHTCDHRLCVNPDHLFLGTAQDNMDDMILKGRDKKAHGSKHYSTKLTDKDILKIRSLSGVSQKEIGRMFEVTQASISLIINNKNWKHVA